MKAKPFKRVGNTWHPCESHEATHIELNMPGPHSYRRLPVIQSGPRRGTPCWTWNGDVDKPTLKPSIKTKAKRSITAEEADRIMDGEVINLPEILCHTHVTDGKVQFLPDCTHELKEQTVDLLDIEE